MIKYRGIKAMSFIIGNETFEKLGSIGTSSNLLVYLTTVFNMKSVSAATLVNVYTGSTNLAPLLGAFLSDTYFGRYKTLAFASISSLLVLGDLNFVYFLVCAKWYRYKGTDGCSIELSTDTKESEKHFV